MEVTHLEYTTCGAAVQSLSACTPRKCSLFLHSNSFLPLMPCHHEASLDFSYAALFLSVLLYALLHCTCVQDFPAFVHKINPVSLFLCLLLIFCYRLCPFASGVPCFACQQWFHLPVALRSPGSTQGSPCPGQPPVPRVAQLKNQSAPDQQLREEGPTWLKTTFTTWFLPPILHIQYNTIQYSNTTIQKKSILTKPLGVRRCLLAFRQVSSSL